jgi:hypothetical protein
MIKPRCQLAQLLDHRLPIAEHVKRKEMIFHVAAHLIHTNFLKNPPGKPSNFGVGTKVE